MDFKLTSQYKPTGDQPEAIKALVEGFVTMCLIRPCCYRFGKTFTIANVIAQVNKPTLLVTTRRWRLNCRIIKGFPENAVEYYVSY